jgi:NAD(P)-dependent dehydrogenase (short-subunit alcohol dehydrogenase family)
MELAGRVAVVTGGGSGIGRAMAEAFARAGAAVVVADIDEAAASAVVQSVRARSGEALGIRTDVSELASLRALADTTFKTFGKVHILCNNAGVALWGGLERLYVITREEGLEALRRRHERLEQALLQPKA